MPRQPGSAGGLGDEDDEVDGKDDDVDGDGWRRL